MKFLHLFYLIHLWKVSFGTNEKHGDFSLNRILYEDIDPWKKGFNKKHSITGINVCEIELGGGQGRYPLLITDAFPPGVVRIEWDQDGEPPNLHCKCYSAQWMICHFIMQPDSVEELMIITRFYGLDPQIGFKPFKVLESDRDDSKIVFSQTDAFGGPKVYAEMHAVHPENCMKTSQCLSSQVDERGIPLCPVMMTPFEDRESIYILEDDKQKMHRGEPVQCVSAIGLRQLIMDDDTALTGGFWDPMRVILDRKVTRKDYAGIFIVFSDQQVAEGICQPKKADLSHLLEADMFNRIHIKGHTLRDVMEQTSQGDAASSSMQIDDPLPDPGNDITPLDPLPDLNSSPANSPGIARSNTDPGPRSSIHTIQRSYTDADSLLTEEDIPSRPAVIPEPIRPIQGLPSKKNSPNLRPIDRRNRPHLGEPPRPAPPLVDNFSPSVQNRLPPRRRPPTPFQLNPTEQSVSMSIPQKLFGNLLRIRTFLLFIIFITLFFLCVCHRSSNFLTSFFIYFHFFDSRDKLNKEFLTALNSTNYSFTIPET